MNPASDSRLHRLLGGDHLAHLRKRLRRHYERSSPENTSGIIRITKLAPAEHAALASMLGRPQRHTSSMLVDIRAMDESLRRSGIALSFRHALEQIDGPITHLATARARLRMLWSDVVSGCTDSRLIRLLERPSGLGLLKRLAKQEPPLGARLCRRAEAVLQHLPAKGIARSQLAASTLGDAHALDNGQAAATLVLAAWRLGGQPSPAQAHHKLDEPGNEDRNSGGERIRDIWAGAGVLVNELARPALYLNLPTLQAKNCGPLAGEPAYISLRKLLQSPPPWDVADRSVHVCENPNLVAIAADHWGSDCAPLVCVDGMPGASQRCLLNQLAGAGARLLYHGDFDWPGLRIGNHVMRAYGARPWGFGTADYLAAVGASLDHGHPLMGSFVEASWDGTLSAAMQQRNNAIAEEAVAQVLLPDLRPR